MRTRLAWVVGLGVLVAGCGGVAADGTVNGKVDFADGTPVTGVTLGLAGPTTQAATTDGSGHFAFTKVVEGAYVLSADVPGTLERHAQVVVSVGKTAVTVPTLTFTAVGALTGTVVDASGNPAEGAEVRLLGTDRAASTDATGAFSLDRVLTGAQTVMASLGTGADRVTGTAQVTVKRGATATASLTLAAPPPPPPAPEPGTVTGTVTYPLAADASTITLTAVGTTATAQPNPDGTFSLNLPPGTYRIDATATHYPEQTLGQAHVVSGQTVALAPKVMSMYRPLPGGGSTDWTTAQNDGPFINGPLDAGGRVLLYQQGPGGFWLYAVDLDTLALHPIAALDGPVQPRPVLDPQGKQVALYTSGAVYVTSIATGTVVTAPVDVSNPHELVFAQDGKSLLVMGDSGVDRLELATGKMTPTAGSSIQQVGPAAFLVETASASGAQTWARVSGAGITSKIFDGVGGTFQAGSSPDMGGTAMLAITTCANAAGCPVVDLTPGATATLPVTLPDGSAYTATDNPIYTSDGPWTILVDPAGGTGSYLLDARTGKTVAAPYPAPRVYVSPDGSELAFINQALTGMYVGLTAAPFAGTEVQGTSLHGTFVSGDTFVAFDESTPARRLVFQGGAAPSVDTDYQAGSSHVRWGMVVWTRPSTGKLAARVGASAAVDLPIAPGTPMSIAGNPGDPTTGTPMPVGALSTQSPAVTYVIDGTSGTVTTYPGLQVFSAFGGTFGAGGLGPQMVLLPADGSGPIP